MPIVVDTSPIGAVLKGCHCFCNLLGFDTLLQSLGSGPLVFVMGGTPVCMQRVVVAVVAVAVFWGHFLQDRV